MTIALARRADDGATLCTVCSSCEALLPVAAQGPGTTLLELRCPHCGTNDVYHVNTLRSWVGKPIRRNS